MHLTPSLRATRMARDFLISYYPLFHGFFSLPLVAALIKQYSRKLHSFFNSSNVYIISILFFCAYLVIYVPYEEQQNVFFLSLYTDRQLFQLLVFWEGHCYYIILQVPR